MSMVFKLLLYFAMGVRPGSRHLTASRIDRKILAVNDHFICAPF